MAEFQEKCRLVDYTQVAEGIYRLTVEAPRISSAAGPGQFVMVRVSDTLDPLLRRPLSIHRVRDDHLSLLFKIIGRGTELLARARVGESLDILGPLGHGFEPTIGRPVCLVGGGMGIAPLYFLADHLRDLGVDMSGSSVLLGARNRDELALLSNEFVQLGYRVQVATDDGSFGHHGFVPELLEPLLPEISRVYTCGPWPMMKTTAQKCRRAGIDCRVSLEAHMACGLGACLGCTLRGASGGYLHVCKQGPVFKAGEVAW